MLFSTIFEGYATAACQSAVLWGTWGAWYLQPNTVSRADALAWAGLMSHLQCACKDPLDVCFLSVVLDIRMGKLLLWEETLLQVHRRQQRILTNKEKEMLMFLGLSKAAALLHI